MIESIGDLVSSRLSENNTHERLESTILCPRATEVVNKLFALLFACCRGFNKYYADKQRLNIEKTQWIHVFSEENYTSLSDIEIAVKKLRRECPVNPPTIKQFLEWNKATIDDMGLPDTREAYNQAVKNSHPSEVCKKWDHEAVQFAWRKTGANRLFHGKEKDTFPEFEYYYKVAAQKLSKGEPLNEVSKALGNEKMFYMDGISIEWRGKSPFSYFVDYKVTAWIVTGKHFFIS
jgi:hypothetical protein